LRCKGCASWRQVEFTKLVNNNKKPRRLLIMLKIGMIMVLVAMMMVVMVPQAGAGVVGATKDNPMVIPVDGDAAEFMAFVHNVLSPEIGPRTDTDPNRFFRYVVARTGSVTVRVLDDATGKPVPGATVLMAVAPPGVWLLGLYWAQLPPTNADGVTQLTPVWFVTMEQWKRARAIIAPGGILVQDVTLGWETSRGSGKYKMDWHTDVYPGLRELVPKRVMTEAEVLAWGKANRDKIARILYDAYYTEPGITPTGTIRLSRNREEVVFGLAAQAVVGGRMYMPQPIEAQPGRIHVYHPGYVGGVKARVKPVLTNPDISLTVRLQPAPPAAKPEPVAVPPSPALPVVQTPIPRAKPVPSPRPEPVPTQETRKTPGVGVPGGGLDTVQVQEPQPVATLEPVPHPEPVIQPEPELVLVQEQADAQGSPIWPIAAAGAAGLGAGLIPFIMLYRRRKK
jgi:hypothetical protein